MAVPVCFTIDNLGLAADVGRGLAEGPDPDEPGLTTGLPAITAVLERHDARATVFAEGWNGIHHPDHIRRLVDAGHEVGMHGWVHETWTTLDLRTERELLVRSVEALDAAGATVKGFRAPGGGRNPGTLTELADLGMVFDSSLDPQPARIDRTGIAVVPFEWEHVDWHWFGRDVVHPPSRFADALHSGLDDTRLDHKDLPARPLVVVVHPRTTGLDAERLKVLESAVERAAGDPAFRIMTMSMAAGWLTEQDSNGGAP